MKQFRILAKHARLEGGKEGTMRRNLGAGDSLFVGLLLRKCSPPKALAPKCACAVVR